MVTTQCIGTMRYNATVHTGSINRTPHNWWFFLVVLSFFFFFFSRLINLFWDCLSYSIKEDKSLLENLKNHLFYWLCVPGVTCTGVKTDLYIHFHVRLPSTILLKIIHHME